MKLQSVTVKNWRNFRQAEFPLNERTFLVGPNASGKSNLMDVFRFMRDICKTDGGGLQQAIKLRDGMGHLRCLWARRDPKITLCFEFFEKGEKASSYNLQFRSEGKGKQRVLVSREEAVYRGKSVLKRTAEDRGEDPETLMQTHLEQASTNRGFRGISDFFSTVRYLHLVPQLLTHADEISGRILENDPYGQGFLKQVASTPERTRDARLRRISRAMNIAAPQLQNLSFVRDEVSGTPHLEAQLLNWRPNATKQTERHFSDGTLRLIAILWCLLEGNGLLLLEEPELSLNEEIVSKIPELIYNLQKGSRAKLRQTLISTHSNSLLSSKLITPDDVISLCPGNNGTELRLAKTSDRKKYNLGFTTAEILLPQAKPENLSDLPLFANG